jgi:hypothetical protein
MFNLFALTFALLVYVKLCVSNVEMLNLKM